MAYQSVWYFTNLPEEIVEILDKDTLKFFDENMMSSQVGGNRIWKKKRDSKNAWIPTTHWIGGFVWHYIMRANRENFLYDLTHIDGESIQYTKYEEGQFYDWHQDGGLEEYYRPEVVSSKNENKEESIRNFLNKNTECVRKLSFVLQLSDPDDYEGGNLELIDESGKRYIAPRKRGTMILFDSRTKHRVNKVTKGCRRSLVGWTVGPRWR
tara:strand:- start:298 stop:927 length:630 start_codon:yes stop_codon:yes gene_type:complete